MKERNCMTPSDLKNLYELIVAHEAELEKQKPMRICNEQGV
jgi:hypothetical protein